MSTPVVMWAAIIKSKRTEWIDHRTIRRLRRDSVKAYLVDWDWDYYDVAMSRVRFARVKVSEIQQESHHAE